MIDFLVGIFHLSFYFLLYVYFPLTTIYRAIVASFLKLKKKELILSIVDISSYSFLLFIPEGKLKKAYRAFHIFVMALAFLAFAFSIHMLVY